MSSLTGDKLAYLIYTDIQFVKDLGNNQILVYDTNHKRQEIIIITDELEEVKHYIDLGWKKKKVLSGIVLMAPEVYLVDLADPFKVAETGGAKESLVLFRVLNNFRSTGRLEPLVEKILKKEVFRGFNSRLIEGPALETEIRIVGSDKRIVKFKEEMVKAIKETDLYKRELTDINLEWPDQPRKINLSKRNILRSKMAVYKELYSLYQYLDRDFALPPNVYGYAKVIPSADIYVLIPHSGFRFLDDLESLAGIGRIAFYERHYSRDGNFWLFKKNFKGKTVLIADISYSGSTLNDVAEMVKLEGARPIKLAIWPKSTISIVNSDYLLFLDRMMPSSQVDLSKPEWPVRLFKQVVFSDN